MHRHEFRLQPGLNTVVNVDLFPVQARDESLRCPGYFFAFSTVRASASV